MASLSPPPLRVLEFYAGVGGFHYALLQSKVKAEIVASVDINTNTNLVYKHNFPDTLHLNRNICGMTSKELDDLKGDVFVLSPPCQPFTRQGQRRDNLDTRTDSFFHLIKLLTEMKSPPLYVLMENVKGFETSHTRDHFTSILQSLNFTYQEFLLSPVQFGIPNSRLRYYLLAKRKPLKFSLSTLQECDNGPCTDASPVIEFVASLGTASEDRICEDLERRIDDLSVASDREDSKSPRDEKESFERPRVSALQSPLSSTQETVTPHTANSHPMKSRQIPSACPHSTLPQFNLDPLASYLEVLSEEQLTKYLVPDKILLKYAVAMDIVRPSCQRSCCFTRAYGHYAVGTGSVIQASMSEEELGVAFEGYQKALKSDGAGSLDRDSLSFLRPLKLRYFTPREVANLMAFPPSFSFPATLTHTQCYKVMGNSLNVHVVSLLIQYMFHNVI